MRVNHRCWSSRAAGACILALALLGCDGAPAPDAGLDAGATVDGGAGLVDAARPDGGTTPGLFAIAGACGELDDAELLAPAPSYFANELTFAMGFTEADAAQLSLGGREILADGNAGGSSLYSEIFAFEVLQRCEGATLLKSETEVVYEDPMGKKTDLLVRIDGHVIGVSVTRAVSFPREAAYDVARARLLLEDKLSDIALSSTNVSDADQWVKQILLVVADTAMHAASVRAAWDALDAGLRGDTILWVTVSEGDDAFLY